MSFNVLVFYSISVLALVILLDKPLSEVDVIANVVGNLISAYVGFVVGKQKRE